MSQTPALNLDQTVCQAMAQDWQSDCEQEWAARGFGPGMVVVRVRSDGRQAPVNVQACPCRIDFDHLGEPVLCTDTDASGMVCGEYRGQGPHGTVLCNSCGVPQHKTGQDQVTLSIPTLLS